MIHATCRLTAKNWDQLRNPTLGSWVWATFTFLRASGHKKFVPVTPTGQVVEWTGLFGKWLQWTGVCGVDHVWSILSVLWYSLLLCAGNDEDDDNAETDGVFQIPDAVFGSAGSNTVGIPVNGKLVSSFRWLVAEQQL